jgi:hypothetical protein
MLAKTMLVKANEVENDARKNDARESNAQTKSQTMLVRVSDPKRTVIRSPT